MTKEKLTVYRKFQDMTWPCPGDRLDDLEWTLRHGQPTQQDLMVSASVIASYQQLLSMDVIRRTATIIELRKGPNIFRKVPNAEANLPGDKPGQVERHVGHKRIE